MGLFEVTKIQKSGKTGKTLGVVRANTRAKAIVKLQKAQKLPKEVRVFPVRIVKSKQKRKRKTKRFKVFF